MVEGAPGDINKFHTLGQKVSKCVKVNISQDGVLVLKGRNFMAKSLNLYKICNL